MKIYVVIEETEDYTWHGEDTEIETEVVEAFYTVADAANAVKKKNDAVAKTGHSGIGVPEYRFIEIDLH